MAGGTGGHVFPGLAVANRMRSQGWEVLWLGTRTGLEADIIPKAGIPIQFITITGLRRKSLKTLLMVPFRLMFAFYQALRLIINYKPDVVLGMGGFVAGPGGIAAWVLRRPLIIHEQNAIAGTTNRWLARVANRVLEGFPESFPNNISAYWVGNPVRENLNLVRKASESNNLLYSSNSPHSSHSRPSHARLKILIIGGSQGALALNQLLPEALSKIPIEIRPLIWHQTGLRELENTQKAYQALYSSVITNEKEAYQALNATNEALKSDFCSVLPFIQEMDKAYAWADLVICRAGALTVSELAMVGVASILIPFPFAVDDHQKYNGLFLEKAGAAKLFDQTLLNPVILADVIIDFIKNPNRLLSMAEAAKRVAKPEALMQVITHCTEVSRESKFKPESQSAS